MNIADVKIDFPVFLAPMAGVTDGAFRRICAEQGAGGCVTEMVSAKALLYRNRGTEKLMRSPLDQGILGLQLFGSDPQIMADMACARQDDYDFIDINMGCPMPKIVGNGEGSALLEKPELAFDIMQTMARALSKPLTVKIRIGVNKEKMGGREIALLAQEAGAAAVFVHGRTRSQLYSGQADWGEIGRIRQALSIPVIGNGDIASAQDALRFKEESGCQGLMVGRAVRGNPWLFREIRAAWEGRPIPPRPGREEMAELILQHIDWEIQDKGEGVACRELRKHLAWYTGGMRGASTLRRKAATVASRQEAESFVADLLAAEWS